MSGFEIIYETQQLKACSLLWSITTRLFSVSRNLVTIYMYIHAVKTFDVVCFVNYRLLKLFVCRINITLEVNAMKNMFLLLCQWHLCMILYGQHSCDTLYLVWGIQIYLLLLIYTSKWLQISDWVSIWANIPVLDTQIK